mgnify:FL=1
MSTARPNYNSRPFWRWLEWHRARMSDRDHAIRKWRGSVVGLERDGDSIIVQPLDGIGRVMYTRTWLHMKLNS